MVSQINNFRILNGFGETDLNYIINNGGIWEF